MKNNQLSNRRHFLKNIITLGTLSAITPSLLKAGSDNKTIEKAGDGFTFLFQGDSITDGGRGHSEDWNHVLGQDYAYLISSRLWYDFPKKGFHFFNRGVSGNTVQDLTARWQKDTLEIKPDLLSILVGINDTSRRIKGDKNFTLQEYESGYRFLLQQTKQQLPETQFVLCAPFILPVGKVKTKWKEYANEIQKKQEVVKRLSIEFDAVHVELQNAFNKALARAPAEYWIWDGVHPMPAGHELIAREWINSVGKKLKFIK